MLLLLAIRNRGQSFQGKSESTFVSNSPRFPQEHCSLEGSQALPVCPSKNNTGLFISPSGTSELDCATTKTDKTERRISIGRESLKFFFCTRGLGVLAGSTARGYSLRKMACTVNKKAFCVLEFAKTESIVTVQRRFRTMYRTEAPTDKTIREW